jgi:hypothetical protein
MNLSDKYLQILHSSPILEENKAKFQLFHIGFTCMTLLDHFFCMLCLDISQSVKSEQENNFVQLNDFNYLYLPSFCHKVQPLLLELFLNCARKRWIAKSIERLFLELFKITLVAKYDQQSAAIVLDKYAPETRDSLMNLFFETPMPNVLNEEINYSAEGNNEEEINNTLCNYLGEKNITTLEDRLRPGRFSEDGFLDEDQKLSSIILTDAALLSKIGVHQDAIALRMEMIILWCEILEAKKVLENYTLSEEDLLRLKTNEAKLEEMTQANNNPLDLENTFTIVKVTTWGRAQEDPFYPTLGNPSVYANQDFIVQNKKLTAKGEEDIQPLSFSKMMPSLIRRFCFFEGPGTHFRVDPLHAARVLDLL